MQQKFQPFYFNKIIARVKERERERENEKEKFVCMLILSFLKNIT